MTLLRRCYACVREWLRAFAEACAFVLPRQVEVPPESGRWVIGPGAAASHATRSKPLPAPAGQQEEQPMKRKTTKRAKKPKNQQGKVKRHRSAVSGRTVTAAYAKKHPRTTVAERK